jgi:hypothetical protein
MHFLEEIKKWIGEITEIAPLLSGYKLNNDNCL